MPEIPFIIPRARKFPTKKTKKASAIIQRNNRYTKVLYDGLSKRNMESSGTKKLAVINIKATATIIASSMAPRARRRLSLSGSPAKNLITAVDSWRFMTGPIRVTVTFICDQTP